VCLSVFLSVSHTLSLDWTGEVRGEEEEEERGRRRRRRRIVFSKLTQ